MADVLSQAQIDALLNSVRSGEKDLEKSPAEQEKKYAKYDFASPRKFTKDRIKMLNGIFENYSRVIGSRLNARLRASCEITVESVEEQHYYEFSNALTEGDVLALADVDIKDSPQEQPVMFYLSTATALSMMDRLMGGEGSVDDDLDSEYSYTELELKLYEDLVQDVISVLGISWENYVPIRFAYNRTDVNPTLSQLLGVDETVVIVDLKLQFTDEIFDSLQDSSLEIVAEMANTQLYLSDIYHLNVGDVIDLGYSKDSPIYLEIGGYHWFTGRMGTHKKNMAVKIDDVCYQAEQRSE